MLKRSGSCAALVVAALLASARAADERSATPVSHKTPGVRSLPATLPSSPLARQTVRATETVLYRKPKDALVADTITSFDVRHVGCVEMRGRDRYTIVIDGVRGREIGWVVGQTLAF